VALMIYIIASSAGVLIIKNFLNYSYHTNFIEFLSCLFNITLFSGVLLYILGFVSWLYVLSRVDLNIAYPIATMLSFIAILTISILFLKERATWNIFIGMILCILGIYVILK
jgi:drug/metabolite transporter (DMT)-like permease